MPSKECKRYYSQMLSSYCFKVLLTERKVFMIIVVIGLTIIYLSLRELRSSCQV